MKLQEPRQSEYAAEFWDATRDERFLLPWCTVTDQPFWYPREVSPFTLEPTVEWREASGTGRVHALSVHHVPGPGRDPEDGPYAVAVVELAEGPRMLTNIVGVPVDEIDVGAEVRVVWHELSDGRKLPMFTPV